MTHYLEHEALREAIAQAPRYCRDVRVHLRLPYLSEMGKEFQTFVPWFAGFRQGFLGQVTHDSVVVRHPEPIHFTASRPVYCEWLLPRDQVVETFGEAEVARLDTEFKVFRSQAVVRALKVDQALLDRVGIETPQAYVPWQREPVTVEEGDFLTDRGFAIPASQIGQYRKLIEP